ncbi:MAG: carbohydrate kinase family protein [Armatimonadetes bacterium]|nr:carbohydrate kinase family protein [Armatimonadota bacterium]
MSSTPELICVGHIVREMIYFPDETKGPVLGSPPAYSSVATGRQGVKTGLVTKVGPDMPAELMKPFADAGVDTSGVGSCEKTTASELIYNREGNKEIRYPAKADPIKAADIPQPFRGCRIVYVCTMDNDVLPGDIPGVVALGQVSAVDLGGYGGVHMSKANRDATPSLVDLACGVSKHFNIVKASDEDAISIFGWDDPDRAASEVLACGPDVVVITAGSKGALVYAKNNKWIVPPLPIKAIDTTGGGDTFMAGFLAEYLRSSDAQRSAQWGSATAACVIEQTGGVRADRMPTHEQVKARMERNYER